MSAKPLRVAFLMLAAGVLAVTAIGCGSNPPCETDLSAVDAARSQAGSAEQALEDAQSQKAQLEQQVADEAARKEELEQRKQDLMDQIKELEG